MKGIQGDFIVTNRIHYIPQYMLWLGNKKRHKKDLDLEYTLHTKSLRFIIGIYEIHGALKNCFLR